VHYFYTFEFSVTERVLTYSLRDIHDNGDNYLKDGAPVLPLFVSCQSAVDEAFSFFRLQDLSGHRIPITALSGALLILHEGDEVGYAQSSQGLVVVYRKGMHIGNVSRSFRPFLDLEAESDSFFQPIERVQQVPLNIRRVLNGNVFGFVLWCRDSVLATLPDWVGGRLSS
jgi:hypothetical protein